MVEDKAASHEKHFNKQVLNDNIQPILLCGCESLSMTRVLRVSWTKEILNAAK